MAAPSPTCAAGASWHVEAACAAATAHDPAESHGGGDLRPVLVDGGGWRCWASRDANERKLHADASAALCMQPRVAACRARGNPAGARGTTHLHRLPSLMPLHGDTPALLHASSAFAAISRSTASGAVATLRRGHEPAIKGALNKPATTEMALME